MPLPDRQVRRRERKHVELCRTSQSHFECTDEERGLEHNTTAVDKEQNPRFREGTQVSKRARAVLDADERRKGSKDIASRESEQEA